MNTEKILDSYGRGAVATLEAAHAIIRNITQENAQDILAAVARYPELSQVIRETTARFSSLSDQEWEKVVTVRSWCGSWNEEIKARLEEQDKYENGLLRVGVGVLSKLIDNPENPR